MHVEACAVIVLTLLARGGSDVADDAFANQDCRVDAFPTQSDFSPDAYQGHWYTVAINRYWMEIPFLTSRFPPTDVQAVYTLDDDGNIGIQTGSSGVLGFGCSGINGLAVAPNKDFPQKNIVTFPGTLFGWFVGAKPYWVLRTDYTGFAVVYACWVKLDDGTCKPGKEFVWTLNRKPEGHTPEQWQQINAVIRDVCIDPLTMKSIEQTGKCNVQHKNLPKDEI
ncbi:purpurin-like [Haliotis rubra]|uniref:purpurin-like n=1 Tax=Haliotis rubra TaxID=36100 RepID=UPI001EE54C5D|nr:purpurin-like [Haliotis rubra]